MSINSNKNDIIKLFVRVTIVHVVTYFIFGIIWGVLLPGGHIMYEINELSVYFRPINDPRVMINSLFQLFRGILIAVAILPFRERIFNSKLGWLYLWGLFAIFSILSTSGASPGSIEGYVYTKLPLWYHLGYLPDIMLQTLTFSLIIYKWERRPAKIISIPMVVLFVTIMLLLAMTIFGLGVQ